jgi:tRNA threonylcarbamoyladenosine biosynthesis protein TsaE
LESLVLDISDESALPEVAEKILAFAGPARIFLFEGPMGAGKTTLIKAICRKLGSVDNLSSPTYAIVNEYSSPAGKLYHFDLYRIKSDSELYDIGFEEYLTGSNYCFIEWPEISLRQILSPYIGIKFELGQKSRKISIFR